MKKGSTLRSILLGISLTASSSFSCDGPASDPYIPASISFVTVGNVPSVKITADLSKIHPSNKYCLEYAFVEKVSIEGEPIMANGIRQTKIIKQSSPEAALIPEPTNGWYTLKYRFVEVK